MIKNLFKAAVNLAVTPLDIAADVMTGCGSLTDQPIPYTAQRISTAFSCLKEALKPEKEYKS